MPGYASIQSARQGSITVMSILAIIFGSLGLLCGGVGVISQLILLATGGRNPFAPTLPAMNNAAVTAYSTFAVLVMFALSAVLLAGGIAGLKLRPWARRAMIWWSIATIIWATTNLVITLLWINPAAAQYVRQVQLQTNPRAVTTMGSVLGPIQVISALIRWALTCALPVCFLILWRSPNVVAAFEGADVPGLPR
jgi:hypothetical protein